MASTPNSSKNSLACGLCFFESPNESAFLSHLNVKHSRDLFFWCRWCGLLFSDRPKYAQHATGDDCAKTYQFNHPCGFEKCEFSTGNPTRFLAHFSRNHRGSSFIRCFYCKRSFTIPACLVEHIQLDCCERPPPGMYNGDSDGESSEPRTHSTSSYKGPYMQAAPTRTVMHAKQTSAAVTRPPRPLAIRPNSPDPDDPQPVNTQPIQSGQSTNAASSSSLYNRLKSVSIRKSRNLINFCKECGIVLSPEKDISEHHSSGQCSGKYKYIHRCGFKYCPYTTGNPQDFIAHFNRAHNGEQFLSCYTCHRSFSIPSCLVEHIQSQCAEPFPHKTDKETPHTTITVRKSPVINPPSKTVVNVEKPPPKRRGRQPKSKNLPSTDFDSGISNDNFSTFTDDNDSMSDIPQNSSLLIGDGNIHIANTVNFNINQNFNSSTPVPIAISRIKPEP